MNPIKSPLVSPPRCLFEDRKQNGEDAVVVVSVPDAVYAQLNADITLH